MVSGLPVARNGRFSNTSETDQFLVCDTPDSISDQRHIWSKIWSATLQAAETIRSGEPQAHLDFERLSEEDQFAFFSGLYPASIAGAHDLSGYTKMLDVGGGSGGFTLGVTEGWPHLRATVLDLSHIVDLTRRFLEDAGTEEHIGLVGADLMTGDCPEDLVEEFGLVILRTFCGSFRPNKLVPRSHTRQTPCTPAVISMSRATFSTTRGKVLAKQPHSTSLNIYEDGQSYNTEPLHGLAYLSRIRRRPVAICRSRHRKKTVRRTLFFIFYSTIVCCTVHLSLSDFSILVGLVSTNSFS